MSRRNKKARNRVRKLIKEAHRNVQFIPENNVNLGIPMNIIRKRPQMETWPDLKEIEL
jgi:hypothetical protein